MGGGVKSPLQMPVMVRDVRTHEHECKRVYTHASTHTNTQTILMVVVVKERRKREVVVIRGIAGEVLQIL